MKNWFLLEETRKVLIDTTLDCPLSKGNQAHHLKFERSTVKISELKFFLTSVKNWCVQLTWKLNEAISSKICGIGFICKSIKNIIGFHSFSFVLIWVKSSKKSLHWAFKYAGRTNSWPRSKKFWILRFFHKVFQKFCNTMSKSQRIV